jgi:putative transposase
MVFARLLDQIMIARPRPRHGRPQTGCADKAYDDKKCRAALAQRGYRCGIRSRGDERRMLRRDPRKRARRWVVERTLSWLPRWRKLAVRHEKKQCNYVGLLCIVFGIIALRAANVLG